MSKKKKAGVAQEIPEGETGQPLKPVKRASEAAENAAPEVNFPIIGIGASAGGLAAFEAFFSGMPADRDPGMAFVLVQHLAPDHKSILADLIKRYTRMQVYEVTDGMAVQPNCAYIIPPNRDMAILNGVLQLLAPSAPRGQRLPIDFFFRSLAQDQRERAVCIILSGTGSDGALGLRAIKGEGGMVMSQTPESTEYDGMPRSAMATGLVDFVLPPAEMAAQLIAYAVHAFGKTGHHLSSHAPNVSKFDDTLKKIFILLRSQVGHDFSQYKHSTISRRIERRMAVHQIEGLNLYLRYLQQNPVEVEELFRDFLIGVTNFFRDPDAFAALEEQVIPRLFAGKPAGADIRVWIPACSTGEEAYSIAILLREEMMALKKNFKLQVFATDLDNQAIAAARSGIYPASIRADVSPERLERFFTLTPDHNAYRINKDLRDLLIFSEQDVIKDPPFSRLDLICCRNLLIYMSGELQKKLLPLFHYALKPGGFLFLGTSETVGGSVDLFSTLDRKAKIYRCNEGIRSAFRLSLGKILLPGTEDDLPVRQTGRIHGDRKSALRELTERALLQHCAPVGALITGNGDILYLHGRSGRYLEPAPGEAGLNILKMAREGLRRELATALHKTISSKTAANYHGLRIKTNGDFTSANLTVQPLLANSDTGIAQTLYLVILEDAPEPLALEPDKTQGTPAATQRDSTDIEAELKAFMEELRAKDEYLNSTREELETSNEELKSSNEEMQSVNEELQSTNEELETSKEELQSVNEELTTVNNELQTKVIDLSQANNDMNNLLAGTGIGTIFVDHQLHIQRFTPAVTQVINLILADVGRPVGHIVSNLVSYDLLVEDIKEVLNTLVPKEVEVQTKDGAWFLLRIRPYRTLENVIEGVVIFFIDINETKRSQETRRQAHEMMRLAAVLRDAQDAITTRDLEGRILTWNPAAQRMYGWSESEAMTKNISDLIPAGLRQQERDWVLQMCRTQVLEPYRSERITKDGRIVPVRLTATALVNEAGGVYAVATTERVIEAAEKH